MTQVYVVIGDSGSYGDDAFDWVAGVFTTEELANSFVKKAQAFYDGYLVDLEAAKFLIPDGHAKYNTVDVNMPYENEDPVRYAVVCQELIDYEV